MKQKRKENTEQKQEYSTTRGKWIKMRPCIYFDCLSDSNHSNSWITKSSAFDKTFGKWL